MVEPGSRYITPDDPRPYFVTGDGVAAVVLDAPRDGEGLLGLWLRNDGTTAGDVTIAHPGLTGKRETIRFHSSHAKILEIAGAAVRRSVDNVLAESGLRLADIDWMVPHQPNGPLLDAVVHAVGIDPGRVVRTVHDTGSVGAASIPIAFHRLAQSGDLRPGNLSALRQMSRVSTNPLVHFLPIHGATHFTQLAPVTALVAKKLLADTGRETNLDFTEGELAALFAR